MIARERTTERMVALFLLGMLALLPPVLLIFNRPLMVAGIPLLYLYLFGAWGGLIGLAALVSRDVGDLAAQPGERAEGERSAVEEPGAGADRA